MNAVAVGPNAASPLWLVTREPLLNELVVYLNAMRQQMIAAPDARHTFEGSDNLAIQEIIAFAEVAVR